MLKKKYKAILFDMDGTLVPMDTDAFTNGYFVDLYKKIAHLGLDKDRFVKAIWSGVKAMVMNDGSANNEAAFWKKFNEITGLDIDTVNNLCLDFYANEFKDAVRFTSPNPLAAKAVSLARKKADKVVLATNPIFPLVGQITRMNWVSLKPEDFDLVTSYESDSYCKPNPVYFEKIFERIGVNAGDCLMIGNDENEDMYAGSLAGMDCYLVRDCIIESKDHPWNGESGSFEDLIDILDKLDEY